MLINGEHLFVASCQLFTRAFELSILYAPSVLKSWRKMPLFPLLNIEKCPLRECLTVCVNQYEWSIGQLSCFAECDWVRLQIGSSYERRKSRSWDNWQNVVINWLGFSDIRVLLSFTASHRSDTLPRNITKESAVLFEAC